MIFRSKWIIADSQTVIENGVMQIIGNRIAKIGKFNDFNSISETVIDLGSAVIMPGFVNAHTHLELTNLKTERVPRFVDWIWQIATTSHIRDEIEWLIRSIRDGITMSIESGTTSIGDIHNNGLGAETIKNSPIRTVVFFETLGFFPNQIEMRKSKIDHNLDQSPSKNDLYIPAISPHAPYSTLPEIYRHAVDLAKNRNLHLATHIAETTAEIEFLRSGTGDFAEIRERLNLPIDHWKPPAITPIAYLKKLGILDLAPLLIHCNYLTDFEIDLIAESQSSVVFCPRSHRYFYHEDHPIERLINSGINVAIGTDSLASNWSLSILDEFKFLVQNFPKIPIETVFDLTTINGAKALRLEKVGKLSVGWRADLIAIEIPDDDRNIFERIADEKSRNLLTIIDGKIVWSAVDQIAER